MAQQLEERKIKTSACIMSLYAIFHVLNLIVLLCGVMEYEDFFENFHWFDLVHDWQDDSGCYVISGDPDTLR